MPPKTSRKKITRRDIKEALGGRNRRRNRIQRNPKGDKFAGMSLDLKYFERNEKEAETSFGFKEPPIHDFKSLTYDELKNLINQSIEKRIGIVGPAGSGKTTLLERLEWDLSQSDKLVVFQNFRVLGNEEKITPRKLFFHDLFRDEYDQKQCYEWILKNQENIIFVLDGLDQAGWSLKRAEKHVYSGGEGSTSDIISSILSKKLFSDIKVVYSSREHAVSSLEGELRPDYVISITGLSDDDAKDLFVRKIGENGEDLWNKMEVSLKPLLSIPAFLNFTIEVYEADQENPPTTLTEIMKRLFLKFMRSEHRQAELTKKEISGLQKLSYNGMKERKPTFKEENFKDVELDWNQMKDFVIVVPCPGETNYRLFDGDKVAIFPHHTIQEFFAGGHIVQMDISDFKKTVEEDLTSEYWSVVTRIVAGLLLNKKLSPEDAKISNLRDKQETLKKMLKSKYGDGQAFARRVASLLSVLSSIAESGDSVFIQSCVKSISLHGHSIGTTGVSTIASVLSHCNHLDTFRLRHCGIDAKGAQLLWEIIKSSALKVDHLDVSANTRLEEGFQYICKLACHCNVKELNAQDCNVQSKQLSWLEEINPSQLNKLLLSGALNITSPFLSSTTGDHEWQDGKYRLDIEESLTISDSSFESIGKVLANRGELSFSYFFTTPSGLQKFQQTLNEKKIVLSKLYFRFTGLNDECCEIVGKIVKQCKISELMMHACKVNSVALGRLQKTVKGTKIINLDVASNIFDFKCCEVIANIVTQCSVAMLNLASCNITNKELDQFLITAKGTKLFKLDVSGNYLTPSAIMKIDENISVDELVNHGQNREISPSSRLLNLTAIDKEIYRKLSEPIIKADEIGPDGGVIELFGCALSLPPVTHQLKRRTQISVTSSCSDGPEGFIVASPELNCEIFDTPLEGLATISLPLHAIPDDGQIQIISKKDVNSKWELIDVHPILGGKNRKVTFQVNHFSPFRAVFKYFFPSWFETRLCRYVFFCPSTSELRGLTCFDTEVVKENCINTLKHEGLTLWSELPDKIVLNSGEEVTYKYKCITPEGLRVHPDTEVITGSVNEFKQNSFVLLPPPDQNIPIVYIESLQTFAQETSTSVLALDWEIPEAEVGEQALVPAAQIEEPVVAQAVVNPAGMAGAVAAVQIEEPVVAQAVVNPAGMAGAVAAAQIEEPVVAQAVVNPAGMAGGVAAVQIEEPVVAQAGARQQEEPVRNAEIKRATREFYELHHIAEDVYPINLERLKGKVLIINNKFQGKDNERVGSEVDLQSLEELWEGMGFGVYIMTNLTAERMQHTCREFAHNTRNVSVAIVIIMSHGGKVGGQEFVTGEDGGKVLSDEIISFFSINTCPNLRDIPKIFMFQACRGDGNDGPVVQIDAGEEVQPVSSRDDMLLVYPCQTGCVAYRNSQDGSRLINAVVSVFKRHAYDNHILELLTKVNNEVARQGGQTCNIQGANQVNHLRKKLFLFPGWP